MTKFTKEIIDDYADKLLIGLTEEENEMVLKEFNIIEENMELIANMPNISEVEPMVYALDDLECTLREDIAQEGLPIEEVMANCKKYEDREIAVVKVVGE